MLLESASVDAVYIALPNAMHAEWTVRALAAGKRVLCEKPLALNIAEADRVITAARYGVLMENFSYHLTPAYRAIQSDGIRAIEAHFSFQATEDHRIRYDRALGGGSFLDLGCYGVDFVHRLLDSQIQVGAHAATVAARWEGELIDEVCKVRGRTGTGRGVEVSITSSFTQPSRQEFVLRYADGTEQRVERADDTLAMLQMFAGSTAIGPAEAVRWRRNAAVYEAVLARMQY